MSFITELTGSQKKYTAVDLILNKKTQNCIIMIDYNNSQITECLDTKIFNLLGGDP